MKQIERNSRGLASVLFEELEALRRGESTPQMARAKSSVASTICAISRLEMDFARFVVSARAEEISENKMKNLPMG